MDDDGRIGLLVQGDRDQILRSWETLDRQPVDWDLPDVPENLGPRPQTTVAREVSVQGPGTFLGKAIRTITLCPTDLQGWWLDRADLPETLPIRVSIRNVWTTGAVVSNIVLRSGLPSNYVRMVEHIVALRMGSGIDNLLIRLDSGDPPLFERGSMDLLDALDQAGVRTLDRPNRCFTVRERVTIGGPNGSFLSLAPPRGDRPHLHLDVAVDFRTAIGRQRIRFPLNRETFRRGAEARTNTSAVKKLYCQTVGRVFADIRNLGYNRRNILIASRWGYLNEARLVHQGKSLEAVWHRAVLDLLAALALVEEGLFCGEVTSYKAGHALDCQMIRHLYRRDLLRPVGSESAGDFGLGKAKAKSYCPDEVSP